MIMMMFMMLIIFQHYGWLNEKRDEMKKEDLKNETKKERREREKEAAKTKEKIPHKHEPPPLTAADQKNIHALKRGLLKSINFALTELLDPAR
jgi:hypothetical protein